MRLVLVGAIVVLMAWGAAAQGQPPFVPFSSDGTAEPLGSFALGLPRINAVVSWDGTLFSVQLLDPVTYTVLATDSFAGHFLPAGVHEEGCKSHNGFEAHSETAPDVYFAMFGRQTSDPCEGTITTEAAGFYLFGMWLVVDGTAPL